MQHLLDIQQLSREDIESLIERAMHFKYFSQYPQHSHHTVALLFYENSTRTKTSFEIAAQHLSMKTLTIDINRSSENKGETLDDTIKTLAAMGISHMVIRHSQDGLPAHLAHMLGNKVHIINAGDGQHAHPSQALLDLMTILEQKPNLQDLKIVIVGNILHSRVAHSLQSIFKTMGVKNVVLVAPTLWQPQQVCYGEVTDDLTAGLADADVIIGLRVQKERLETHEQLDLVQYKQAFCLTTQNIQLAKPDALILHPGPMNRGLEIESAVADGPQSYILQQVTNGVFMRMAILDALSN